MSDTVTLASSDTSSCTINLLLVPVELERVRKVPDVPNRRKLNFDRLRETENYSTHSVSDLIRSCYIRTNPGPRVGLSQHTNRNTSSPKVLDGDGRISWHKDTRNMFSFSCGVSGWSPWMRGAFNAASQGQTIDLHTWTAIHFTITGRRNPLVSQQCGSFLRQNSGMGLRQMYWMI